MPPSPPSSPTLTNVTQVGRKAVIVAGVLLVVLIVGRFFVSSLYTFWKALNPPPPPPPTVGFGLLPPIVFPEETATAPQTYELETPSGGLPSFADRAKVFLVKRKALSLLSDETARKIAAAYDFIFEPEVIDATTYRWRRSQPLTTNLEMNIQTHQFELATDYVSRPDLLANPEVITDYDATNRVKNMLKRANLLGSDVATASGQVEYLKVLGGTTVPAVSLSDADILRVNLSRTPIDGIYPMFTPVGDKANISALVLGSLSGNESVVELSYNYHEIDYSEIHTYPLRPVRQAWEVLKAGEGYIASGDSQTAIIREVVLGYYDGFQVQDYLQPIYVFKGDDGFLGYVPAIDPLYVQTPAATTQ